MQAKAAHPAGETMARGHQRSRLRSGPEFHCFGDGAFDCMQFFS